MPGGIDVVEELAGVAGEIPGVVEVVLQGVGFVEVFDVLLDLPVVVVVLAGHRPRHTMGSMPAS